MRTCCSSRGLGFVQFPSPTGWVTTICNSSSQPSIISAPGDQSRPLSPADTGCMWCTDTHEGKSSYTQNKKKQIIGCRPQKVVKSTCSCRSHRLESQHPHGGSKLSTAPVMGHPVLFSDTCSHPAHMQCTDIHVSEASLT